MPTQTCTLHCLSNRDDPEALQALLPALADLRVRVFRDFPYLYDGSPEAELKYLAPYAQAEDNLLVAVCPAGDSPQKQMVGASTALPLKAADAPFRQAFTDAGIDPESVFYFGESVLLPDYRGAGLGHRFFDERERFAREQGYAITTFCAVTRANDHPARPRDYRSLEAFWQSRGYRQVDGLSCDYPWKEIGQPAETQHAMQFWIRQL